MCYVLVGLFIQCPALSGFKVEKFAFTLDLQVCMLARLSVFVTDTKTLLINRFCDRLLVFLVARKRIGVETVKPCLFRPTETLKTSKRISIGSMRMWPNCL